MSADKLEEINYRLANPPEFDLSDSEQLGLFVAGRLAKRHNIKISMRQNAFGGSTAIVLIPNNLIVTGDNGRRAVPARPGDVGALPAGGRHDGGSPSTGSNGQRRPANALGAGQDPDTASVATDRPARPGPAPSFAGGSTPDRDGAQPDLPTRPGRSSDQETPSPEPDWATASAAPRAPDATLASPQVTTAGLPRRVRQTSLAPELRTGIAASVAAEPDAAGHRSPEQTRTLMSSLQRGWERGRSARPPEDVDFGVADRPAQSHSARHEGENGADR
jgi:hypothetical protein